MRPPIARSLSPVSAALGAGLLSACSGAGRPMDLLAAPDRLVEASVAGHDKTRVLQRFGGAYRLYDTQKRTLPAGPPSRLRFALDIPKNARLTFACAIAERFQDRPGIEFMVKARHAGREELVFSRLLDPLRRPEERGWVPGEVDLARYAGNGAELILETHGYEQEGDLERAFWGTPALAVPGLSAPLVVVYLVDTLRADHTGPYGYSRDTTPSLVAFARDGVVFEKAIAASSWTKPSVASLFTSQLPGQHRAVQLRDPLDASAVTLAEMLQAKGYGTGAAIGNSVIYLAESNFDQGFDSFAGLHGDAGRPSKLVAAAKVVDAGLAFLEARAGLPSFLYVHTMDPHVPYAPPAPYDRKFEPHPIPDHPAQDPRTDYKEPLDRERLMAQYDGDIAYGDQEFGRFVRRLQALGVYEDALVVFLGDHGEEFLDHGQWLHGRSVFDELVRVPLVVKFPGRQDAGRRLAEQVQLIDILPTVLASQGLPVPQAPAISGRPLQAVLRGGVRDASAISELSHRGIVASGIRTNRDKYVRRFSPEEDELYFDLLEDPRESKSILGRAPERERALRAGLEASLARNPFRYVVKAAGSGEYRLAFRSSGYIEAPESVGLGAGERSELSENGHRLETLLRPRPGAPREIAFTLRPMGAPVSLAGSRDGRPLRPTDVAISQAGFHPGSVPFRLPRLEAEDPGSRGGNLFKAPGLGAAGLSVWLALDKGRTLIDMDREACERMRALGYVGSCAGP